MGKKETEYERTNEARMDKKKKKREKREEWVLNPLPLFLGVFLGYFLRSARAASAPATMAMTTPIAPT